MMRFRPETEAPDADDSVLPLINIVFLLLIFFMLAGALSAADPFEIEAPDSLSEAPDGIDAAILYIAADGGMHLEDAPVTDQNLDAILASRAGSGLRIKADKALAAVRLVDVMERARKAGLTQVVLMTLEPERGVPERGVQ